MSPSERISVHWFRRDLRLEDNHALYRALTSGHKVLPLFLFDSDILSELEPNDARVSFIHERLSKMHAQLSEWHSGLLVKHGNPLEVLWTLIQEYPLAEVHTNADYEPYALQRDQEIAELLQANGIAFHTHKDQVVFEKSEVTKDDGGPYTVYTPYSKKWLSLFSEQRIKAYPTEKYFSSFFSVDKNMSQPKLEAMGFKKSAIRVPELRLEEKRIKSYEATRNFPAEDGTSLLSTHLRFGTISVREAFRRTMKVNHTFAKELIWREFFMQILFHFPNVVHESFRSKYDRIPWRNNETEFKAWCEGKTGYPMVDAGMRELNATGLMHNRVRMVVASFLCKHLLIDWRWGEAYFAKKLLDYELSSNNGNWQWAAGTGCDAAPYFRVFNPSSQMEKFDANQVYIKKWIPELGTSAYPKPIVEHKMARERAIKRYKSAIA